MMRVRRMIDQEIPYLQACATNVLVVPFGFLAAVDDPIFKVYVVTAGGVEVE